MFNGYVKHFVKSGRNHSPFKQRHEHNGRVLKVHHDKFSSQLGDNANKIASPILKAHSPAPDSSMNRMSNHHMGTPLQYHQQPQSFTVPQPQYPPSGFASPLFRAFTNSQPGSPYDGYPPPFPNGAPSHDYNAPFHVRNTHETTYNGGAPFHVMASDQQQQQHQYHQQGLHPQYPSHYQYLHNMGPPPSNLQSAARAADHEDASARSSGPSGPGQEPYTRSRSDSVVVTKSTAGDTDLAAGAAPGSPTASRTGGGRPSASAGASGQTNSSPYRAYYE